MSAQPESPPLPGQPPAAPQLHYLRLLRALVPHGIEIGLCSLLVNACGLLMPVFSMLVYDKVVGNSNNETLWTLAAGMVLVLLLEFGLRMLRGYAVERLGAMAEARMESHLVDRVLGASAQQVAAPGVLMSRYRDLAGARDALFAQYAVAAADLPFLFLFLLVLGFIGGPLAAVPVLWALPMLAGQWLAGRPQRDYGAQGQAAAAHKASLLADLVAGLAFLQTSALRHVLVDRWEREVRQGALLRGRQRFWQTAVQSWGGMCIGMASVTLLACGVYRIESGAMSVGALIACSLIQLRTMLQLSSVVSLVVGWKDLTRTQSELDRLAQPGTQESAPKIALPPGGNEVSLLHLTCRSADGQAVLDDVNLWIARGERVALVGRPGSGKSTLLRCLAGVQQPSQGQVLMNGARVDTIDLAGDQAATAPWLSYKPQEPVIIGPLLQDDLGALQGDRADRALALTGLSAALRNGEMRRDQRVNEGGARMLSGGQCQIVSLARALAADAQCYLLDEPTASVDAETEARLAQAVDEMTRGRTVVVATHSTALLHRMDRIVVLERGRVVANGPREQLLASVPVPSPSSHASSSSPSPAPAGKATAQPA